jgi:hypothetical protein
MVQVVHGGANDRTWLGAAGLTLLNIFDTEKACQVGLFTALQITFQAGEVPSSQAGQAL